MSLINQESNHFPPSFFRVSIKALVVRDGKILLQKEGPSLGGQWELLGGGLDFGEDIHSGLRREIQEETGIKVKSISKHPIYSWTWRFENRRGMDWYYSLVLAYQVELESLDFTPSEECQEMRFFSKDELTTADLCHQTRRLPDFFDPNDFIS